MSPAKCPMIAPIIKITIRTALSAIPMLSFENPSLGSMLDAKWSILYAGVLSSGVAYTLQVVAQKNVNPTGASLIMCLESVVAVLAGWIILGEGMSSREIWGCLLMFAAIVVAQLPVPKKTKERD